MSFACQGSQTIFEAITSRGVHWIGLSPSMVYTTFHEALDTQQSIPVSWH